MADAIAGTVWDKHTMMDLIHCVPWFECDLHSSCIENSVPNSCVDDVRKSLRLDEVIKVWLPERH